VDMKAAMSSGRANFFSKYFSSSTGSFPTTL
jgi:hypothetical protein